MGSGDVRSHSEPDDIFLFQRLISLKELSLKFGKAIYCMARAGIKFGKAPSSGHR